MDNNYNDFRFSSSPNSLGKSSISQDSKLLFFFFFKKKKLLTVDLN